MFSKLILCSSLFLATNSIYSELSFAQSSKSNLVPNIKNSSHKNMQQLQGWCSNYKADLLIDLVMLTNPQTVVEIGVFGGKSLLPMAEAVKQLKNGGKVYGIDPWEAHESEKGMEDVNKNWWASINYEKILKDMMDHFEDWKLLDTITIIRKSSADAPEIPNIDILHIDGNHSDEASMIDVLKWVPLVRKGGFIVFDDIDWSNSGEAKKWLDVNCVRVAQIHDTNQWAIWVKP